MDLPRLHGRRPEQKFHLLNRRGLIIVLLRRRHRRSQPTTMQMDGRGHAPFRHLPTLESRRFRLGRINLLKCLCGSLMHAESFECMRWMDALGVAAGNEASLFKQF